MELDGIGGMLNYLNGYRIQGRVKAEEVSPKFGCGESLRLSTTQESVEKLESSAASSDHPLKYLAIITPEKVVT